MTDIDNFVNQTFGCQFKNYKSVQKVGLLADVIRFYSCESVSGAKLCGRFRCLSTGGRTHLDKWAVAQFTSKL